jgi:hypothetical protein
LQIKGWEAYAMLGKIDDLVPTAKKFLDQALTRGAIWEEIPTGILLGISIAIAWGN